MANPPTTRAVVSVVSARRDGSGASEGTDVALVVGVCVAMREPTV